MSQLVDNDTLNLMIDESAGDLDNVVLPEDNGSALTEVLDSQIDALGRNLIKIGKGY